MIVVRETEKTPVEEGTPVAEEQDSQADAEESDEKG